MKRFTAMGIVTASIIGGYVLANLESDHPTAAPINITASSTSNPLVPEDTDAITSTSDVLMSALMDPAGEYAAYAEYTAVIAKYGAVEPYVSIQAAELRHINALMRQLQKYGVEIPDNPYLATAVAPESLQEAAAAWAQGEVVNVELYDTLLTKTTDANAIRVLNNLRSASLDKHLPMFTLAAKNGGTLTSEQMQGM